jgi:hypothetical protein
MNVGKLFEILSYCLSNKYYINIVYDANKLLYTRKGLCYIYMKKYIHIRDFT